MGTHIMTVSYPGDSFNGPSSSLPLSQVVKQAQTATTITAAPSPGIAGGPETITATVKVTYTTTSRILLTHMENFVVGIGRDVRIEKQRNIFRRVNMYAITAKVAVQVEETDALVDGYNIGLTI